MPTETTGPRYPNPRARLTEGYEVEAHEPEGLMAHLLGDVLSQEDPLIRYHELTREQALFDAMVSAIKRRRGAALEELRRDRTLAEVAELAGLGSQQRVGQLIRASKLQGPRAHVLANPDDPRHGERGYAIGCRCTKCSRSQRAKDRSARRVRPQDEFEGLTGG